MHEYGDDIKNLHAALFDVLSEIIKQPGTLRFVATGEDFMETAVWRYALDTYNHYVDKTGHLVKLS